MRSLLFAFMLVTLCGLIPSRGWTEEKSGPGGLLVIATSAEGEKALAPLVALRQGQGWEVTIRRAAPGTKASELYKIIKAERTRAPRLTHLLLAGSHATLPMSQRPNLRIQLGDDERWIWTDQPYGGTATSGTLPLAIGRLPADEPAALGRLAEKIVVYEKSLEGIKPELFLFSGRQLADPTPKLMGISEQSLADTASATFVHDLSGQLTRIKAVARTAFPGPAHFEFAQGPEVLRQALAARPTLMIYAGHANRDAFATCHDERHHFSIQRADIERMDLKTVCGPFFSGGCSMLEPEDKTPSIGEALVMHAGGPVAFAGFTGPNDDFVIMQSFEILVDELTRARRTTLGELLATLRRRLATEPQSARSQLVQGFMESGGALDPSVKKIDYPAVVKKSNELLTLVGDPCTTVVIP